MNPQARNDKLEVISQMSKLYLELLNSGRQPSKSQAFCDWVAYLGRIPRDEIKENYNVYPQRVLELFTALVQTAKGLDGANMLRGTKPTVEKLLVKFYNEQLPWWRKLLRKQL